MHWIYISETPRNFASTQVMYSIVYFTYIMVLKTTENSTNDFQAKKLFFVKFKRTHISRKFDILVHRGKNEIYYFFCKIIVLTKLGHSFGGFLFRSSSGSERQSFRESYREKISSLLLSQIPYRKRVIAVQTGQQREILEKIHTQPFLVKVLTILTQFCFL